jgi:hypothetical protein
LAYALPSSELLKKYIQRPNITLLTRLWTVYFKNISLSNVEDGVENARICRGKYGIDAVTWCVLCDLNLLMCDAEICGN